MWLSSRWFILFLIFYIFYFYYKIFYIFAGPRKKAWCLQYSPSKTTGTSWGKKLFLFSNIVALQIGLFCHYRVLTKPVVMSMAEWGKKKASFQFFQDRNKSVHKLEAIPQYLPLCVLFLPVPYCSCLCISDCFVPLTFVISRLALQVFESNIYSCYHTICTFKYSDAFLVDSKFN